MVKKKIIVVIPARGGSKRIPRKNIVSLCGKPMIAWTIQAALESKYISKVVVSTDDEEIAEVSREYGAEVPFLRDQNADDHSPISLATIRTLEQLEEVNIIDQQIVVQLMANCPLRSSEDIDKAVENFISKRLHFQISSFKYGWMNPWWAHKIDEEGKAIPVFEEKERMKRSQDQPDLYCPTGAIWIADIQELKKAGTFYGPDYRFFPLHWVQAIDIDEYEDLEMAKYFLK
ncbi:acylneuraminate cytidylyltransferase family protein [Autumnicola edwardsiae]|uniref:Acylneuraminate cytidylyltransferase family protein n=1 Tax=Autumnicola edwardsiae TaxID=3075594 RepID=A0ABU3CTU6_9FLAO|nr:acylneuraminate cytidylyltransferase family protein [Zunongwangia sp. F297]MDT0649648.1 acylneuraminate cytidylyltransferase family protein [Zunongwangia sp. F297]